MKNTFKKFYEKIKESFQTALVAAFIILTVLLLLYVPFKVIPKMMSNSSSFFATTLSSLFVSGDESSTDDTTTKTTLKKETSTTKNTSAQSPVYYGKADLSISLLGTGIINKNTGQFYQTSSAGLNDIVGVRFEVKNIGTNISGIWRIRLVMPSKSTPIYDSEYQISLRPGDRIEYTASFERPTRTGNNIGYITADYFNNVDESVESNNYLTIPIKIVSGNITNYNNNYYNEIKLSCGANTTRTSTGNIVTWSATVTGGIGQPLYSWYGSDGLLSIQSTQNGVNKIYYNTGTKTARVAVSIGNEIVSKECGSVTIR
jgi:hypothetical protein